MPKPASLKDRARDFPSRCRSPGAEIAPLLHGQPELRHIVLQGLPDNAVVDCVIDVIDDDAHPADRVSWTVGCIPDDLLRQLRGHVAGAAADGFTRESQGSFGLPPVMSAPDDLCCGIDRLVRSARKPVRRTIPGRKERGPCAWPPLGRTGGRGVRQFETPSPRPSPSTGRPWWSWPAIEAER